MTALQDAMKAAERSDGPIPPWEGPQPTPVEPPSTAVAAHALTEDMHNALDGTLTRTLAQMNESMVVGEAAERTADKHRDSLYRGTTNVVTMLEEARDRLSADISADLNLRCKEAQTRIDKLDGERVKAMELAESLSAQCKQEREALNKDMEETGKRLLDETTKFGNLISLQRGLLEQLR